MDGKFHITIKLTQYGHTVERDITRNYIDGDSEDALLRELQEMFTELYNFNRCPTCGKKNA